MLWQLHLYDLGKFFETVIRYFVAKRRPALAVRRLPIRVSATSLRCLPIPFPRRPRRRRTRTLATTRRAVPLAAVAAAAQVEQLSARDAPAQDKAK